jgi:hypothetical protein
MARVRQMIVLCFSCFVSDLFFHPTLVLLWTIALPLTFERYLWIFSTNSFMATINSITAHCSSACYWLTAFWGAVWTFYNFVHKFQELLNLYHVMCDIHSFVTGQKKKFSISFLTIYIDLFDTVKSLHMELNLWLTQCWVKRRYTFPICADCLEENESGMGLNVSKLRSERAFV